MEKTIGQETELASTVEAALPPSTLIICSRNRPELLEAAVASVLAGTEVPAELLIVDQSDGENLKLAALTTIRPCAIRYIWSKEKGLSRANNLGAATANNDILVFTHDDVLVSPGWYGTIVRALVEAGPRSVVSGQVQVTDEEKPGGFQLTLKTEQQPAIYQGRINRDVLLPLNMAMYRAALNEVNGFDVRLGPGTGYPAAEDNDFGFRLLEKGYRVIYEPCALIYHRAFRDEKDFLPLRWSYGVGRGAFYAKHLDLHDRYILKRMLRDVKEHLWILITWFRSSHGNRKTVVGHAVLAFGIIFGAGKWLITQRQKMN